MNLEFRDARRADLFVGVHCHIFGMPDFQQPHRVDVADLPKFLGNEKAVLAIGFEEPITIDFQVLPLATGSLDTIGKLKPDWCRPQTIGEEGVLLSIPRVDIRARAFEFLLKANNFVRLRLNDVLGDAVGPKDSD